MLLPAIILDLRTGNEKLFFEMFLAQQEITLPMLFAKIPISSLYRILSRLKLFEVALGITLFLEKEILSKNNHLCKVLKRNCVIEKIVKITEDKAVVVMKVVL